MQGTTNSSVTIGATSVEIAPAVSSQALKRTSLMIVNTSAAAVVTIAKGTTAAVANQGIVLQPTGLYVESNSANFETWQGAVQAVGTAAGSVAVVESWESKD